MASDGITQAELPLQEVDKQQNPHRILGVQELGVLNERSNRPGVIQLAGHLAIIGVSGYFWVTNLGNWLLGIPALIIYGFSLATMFAALHECVHRTAFANNRCNDICAWCAGVLSFYNSTFYRHYHKWHHLYTRVVNKDPELTDLTPKNFGEYLLVLSGLLWWVDKIRGHFRAAFGQLDNCPYIPDAAKTEVIRSTQLQLAVYGIAITLSIAVSQPLFVIYWLLPLFVGQPILRFILLAEHTDCTLDNNLLTNTRTTLTIPPIQFLMWNMPFHAEHHLYPSIPFHLLPSAHEKLRARFSHVELGYINVHRKIIANIQNPTPN